MRGVGGGEAVTVGLGKGFHTGASAKQLIYLLIQKCVCATQCAAHQEHPQGKQGSPPGQPCWVWFKLLILVSGENPSVCGSCLGCVVWDCLERLPNFMCWSLVTDYWEKSLPGQWVLQVLEGRSWSCCGQCRQAVLKACEQFVGRRGT